MWGRGGEGDRFVSVREDYLGFLIVFSEMIKFNERVRVYGGDVFVLCGVFRKFCNFF